ncbi:MAG TPA: glycosyltransferase [Candidatus Binatia bacterium]|nr:glycosyltransferase [Candidatus Binatia bacterium]
MRRILFVVPLTEPGTPIAAVLNRVRAQMTAAEFRCMVVAIDDGGGETTREQLREAGSRMPLHTITHRFPRGWGESLRDGLEWVADHGNPEDVAIVMDADDSHAPECVPALLAAVDRGADVAVASRFCRGAGGTGRSWSGRALSWLGALSLRPFLGLADLKDPTGGFYAVRVPTLRSTLEAYRGRFLELSTWDRACSAEALVKLARSGARCVEVPLTQRGDQPPAARRSQRNVAGYVRLIARTWLATAASPPVPSPPVARWEWRALAALLLIALALRVYRIDRIPAVVIHDECDNLFNVYQILQGKGPGFFGVDWKPQPAASIYVLSWFMWVSNSVTALRLPTVMVSVAALVPFFLLLRTVVAVPVALLTTGLLAADTWYLHFSRTGWDNIDACLFLLAAVLCLRRAVRNGQWRWFAATGIWCALGLYGPFGGRAILPITLLIGLMSLRRAAMPRGRLLAGLLLSTAVAIALLVPQLRTALSDWDGFQKRTRFVYVLGGENETKPALTKLAIVLEASGRKAYQLFAPGFPIGRERTDRYLRTETGAFSRPTAVLLGIGMLAGLLCLAQTWHWWVVLVASFVLTEGLTIGNLNGARGIVFVPILYLFIGLAIEAGWTVCRRLSRALPALVVVAALALGASTSHQYFEWAQSQLLLNALEPSIPVDEFPAWQTFVREWIATRPEFFNVGMWKTRQAQQRAAQAGSPPQ